jgi:hypothetical protein
VPKSAAADPAIPTTATAMLTLITHRCALDTITAATSTAA